MLDSIPAPWQAILWPLVGAALILALGRVLPNWARRLLALAAALASLAVLWSLKAGPVEWMGIEWLPTNLFRMGPRLNVDGLSLLMGMLLAVVTAALILGIRGRGPKKTSWHGLLLILLAGCLAAIMAANLLALALASALVDLALIATTLSLSSGAEPSRRLPLSTVVPGLASTMVLFVAALQMDSQAGHASLLSQNLPEGPLVLAGVAGALRALVFPLQPRSLGGPVSAATLLLPVGVGGYLLVRVQSLVPVLTEQPWAMIVAAVALLVGGLLAWSSSAGSIDKKPAPGGFWSGTLVQQTAYVLAFVLLLAGATPWPLVGLLLALGVLTVWWEGGLATEDALRSEAAQWMTEQIRSWQTRAQSYATTRVPRLGRWRNTWFGRYGVAFLPAIALASLMGAPFTVGARGRWPFYAVGLKRGDTTLLIILAADTFLAAGLWIAVTTVFRQARKQRIRGASLLAMLGLAILLVVLGIAPGILSDDLGLKAVQVSGVSVWGLGLVYVLPWLLGAWLGRMRGTLGRYLDRVHAAANLDWLYSAAGWAGERLVGAIRWLGVVGEGDGWWGWVLIILALGVFLLVAR
jgi:hypothetical protein